MVIIGFAAVGGYWYYHHAIGKQLAISEEIFLISQGDTLNGIANRLVKDGVIREPWSLRLLGRQQGTGQNILAGEYDFPETLSLAEFLDSIVQGKYQVDVRVTILEAWTFKQMREALRDAERLKQTTDQWTDQQVMAALGHPDLHPEGQFYPDTYYYRANDPDMSLYRKSFALMQQHLQQAWGDRSSSLPLKDPYEALILASIIEKETQALDEQPIIAGVFMNRLNKGMRLQTDPTVIYGIGDAYNGDITRKHLKTDTPYNTYTRSGLTPTPISLPGMSSLEAAVKPAATEALYFVAKGGGRHQFSRTLAEHNRAVNKYIRNKAQSTLQ